MRILTILMCMLVCLACENGGNAPNTDKLVESTLPKSNWKQLTERIPELVWKDTITTQSLEKLTQPISYKEARTFWIEPAATFGNNKASNKYTFLILPEDIDQNKTWEGKNLDKAEPIMLYSVNQFGEFLCGGMVNFPKGDRGLIWILHSNHPVHGIGMDCWIGRYDSLGKMLDYAPLAEDLINDYGQFRRTYSVPNEESDFHSISLVNMEPETEHEIPTGNLSETYWTWDPQIKKYREKPSSISR